MNEAPESSWMIVELMGHQRMAGLVSEVTMAGHGMIRIDVPAAGEEPAYTRFVSPTAVYALNPTTEALARRAAAAFRPRVVNEWDLPRALPPADAGGDGDVDRCVPIEPGEDPDDDEYEDVEEVEPPRRRDGDGTAERLRCGACDGVLFTAEEESRGLCEGCVRKGDCP